MSKESFNAFMAQVTDDANLQAKLAAATQNASAADATKAVIAIASEVGHEITTDDLTELSDEALDQVAGGGNWFTKFWNNIGNSDVVFGKPQI
ncbi:Nif11-like leader peptide family natural product precursor [Spiribacter sp. C176]|uniref:Nif11-like leader peptide family natural product n=1 Tax=Spiribacter salilacus TaxID=2664894 RepID=A0A6N7QQK0_9GAMM|nr:Nif11-like leader peptide family RiPP precursor [Spiribacter salilacus]MRH77659.1 Nif11-like leader peptide family natural product precursor [Spiribacter salilacus]